MENKSVMKYYHDFEPLMANDRLAELMIALIGFDSINPNKKAVTFEIPAYLLEKLDTFMTEGMNNEMVVSRIARIIDLEEYYNNNQEWEEYFIDSFNHFFEKNEERFFRVDNPNNGSVIVTCRANDIIKIIKQYPSSVISPCNYLVSFLMDENDINYGPNKSLDDGSFKYYIKNLLGINKNTK